MRNIRLTVAYSGAEYAGCQRQRDEDTIQSRLEEAVLRATGESVNVVGAGRTDAGVHATGQVVSYRSETTIPIGRIPHALNGALPPDIAVVEAMEAPEAFHPRYDAIARCYKYAIEESPRRNAFRERYVWRVEHPLNVAKMREAAEPLIGQRDFGSFGAPMHDEGSTVRTVFDLRIGRRERIVHVTIWADAFLRGMVRTVVGVLADAGWGRLHREDVEQWVEVVCRGAARPKAPAGGLYLACVRYGPESMSR